MAIREQFEMYGFRLLTFLLLNTEYSAAYPEENWSRKYKGA